MSLVVTVISTSVQLYTNVLFPIIPPLPHPNWFSWVGLGWFVLVWVGGEAWVGVSEWVGRGGGNDGFHVADVSIATNYTLTASGKFF